MHLFCVKAFTLTPMTYIFLQVCHAICQSTGWPTCIKVLAVWVLESRGLVMGLWTTCQSLGGVMGAILAAWLLSSLGRKWAYLGHIPILLTSSYLCYHYVYDENMTKQRTMYKESDLAKKVEALNSNTDHSKLLSKSFAHSDSVYHNQKRSDLTAR